MIGYKQRYTPRCSPGTLSTGGTIIGFEFALDLAPVVISGIFFMTSLTLGLSNTCRNVGFTWAITRVLPDGIMQYNLGSQM